MQGIVKRLQNLRDIAQESALKMHTIIVRAWETISRFTLHTDYGTSITMHHTMLEQPLTRVSPNYIV